MDVKTGKGKGSCSKNQLLDLCEVHLYLPLGLYLITEHYARSMQPLLEPKWYQAVHQVECLACDQE